MAIKAIGSGYTPEGNPGTARIVSKTGGSNTLAVSDQGALLDVNNSSSTNLNLAPDSSVFFPTGTQIDILQSGAGQVTVVAGSGVTINTALGLKLRTQWSAATLIKRSANTWVLIGDLSA